MTNQSPRQHTALFTAARHGILPAVGYLACFAVLGYSLLGTFFTEFWGDRMDALQNAWNLWWVNLALHHPDQYPSIWQTSLLHWPFGTTLVAHTLGPFNGYLGAVLQTFLSLTATYNAIMVFGFVMGGLTMYWLAYHLTKSYWSSLAAGFLFAFSSYGVMHLAAGQMNVVSLEWMPLFLLCWTVLLTRPGLRVAVGAAAALWLVALCDYYFLLYCVFAGALMLGWRAAGSADFRSRLRRDYAAPLAVFAGVSVALIGPLILPLVQANQQDPFAGAHNPADYSLDLLALAIPGRTWIFGGWTRFYWSQLVESSKEGEGYLALPVYVLMAYLWAKRKTLDREVRQQLYLWSAMLAVFFLLALGPVLHVAGKPVWDKAMPYTLLTGLLPFVGLSGIPARMTVMVVLSASVLSAFGLRELLGQFPRTRLLTAGLLAVLLFQMIPAPIASTSVKVPEYITALEGFPDNGGTINLVGINPSVWLYYQTVHAKPIAFGYISRVQASVLARDKGLQAAIDARDYEKLWGTYQIRYVIAAEAIEPPANAPDLTITLMYERKEMRVYRLGCRCEAAR